MKTAFLALVNYAATLLLILFNGQAFFTLYKKMDSRGVKKSVAMKAEMIGIFLLCYITLYLRSNDRNYLLFFVLQAGVYTVLTHFYRRLYPKLYGLLHDQMLLLLGVGGVMLARLDAAAAVRQFIIVSAALLLGLLIPGFIRAMHRLERYGYVYLGAGLLVLVGVFLFAGERLGARIWVKLFGVSMQPFEFVKISFIFGCAAVLLRAKKWQEKAAVFVFAGAHILIMAASKDLGGALLFALVFFVLLYASDGKKLWFVCGAAGGTAACIAAYSLFSHVRVRVLAWQDPFAVVDNEGYQLAQGLFAIGNGGFWGTGLLRGAPDQIPVVTTDYIFSALCEEMGALFALGLLCVYLNCLFLLIRLIKRCTEDYYRLVFTGFAALFSSQILLNVGGVIRMIPSTGVPLPFISAGGSSAASMILMFLMIQGMQERGQAEQEKEYKDGFVPASLSPKAQKAVGHCTVACCVVVLFTAAYFMVFSLTEARGIIFHSYNRRQGKLEEQNAKGAIYDADGNPIAFTVFLDGEELRKYPYGRLFSHVVGQTFYGKSGLEAVKEIDLLTASVGELTKLTYRIRGAQIPGNNLFTTLQTKIQQGLYEILEDNRSAPIAGCVIDISTGGLLASVSLPDFVPEAAGESETEADAPLFNRVFYGEYPVSEENTLFSRAADCFSDGLPTPFGELLHPEKRCLTPAAAAMFACAAAGDGTYPEVYVAKKLTDADGRELYHAKQEKNVVCDAATAERFFSEFAINTEAETPYAYYPEKTAGSAKGRYLVMEIAVFPATDPKYAVCLTAEECTEEEILAVEKKLEEIGKILLK